MLTCDMVLWLFTGENSAGFVENGRFFSPYLHHSNLKFHELYVGVSKYSGTPKWMVKIMENFPIKMG